MYPLIHVFGRTYGTYSICALLGLFFCCIVATKLSKRHGQTFEDILLVVLSIIGGLLVGGSILYAITNIRGIFTLFAHIQEIPFTLFVKQFAAFFGGTVYYGGFFGAIAAIYIYTCKSKRGLRPIILDVFAVCTPLFHLFGRIGCFFGGCCYGVESRFGFTAHGNPLSPAVNDVSRFPIQLVEALGNLVIFLVLINLFRKRENRPHFPLIYVYMFLYPPMRFVLEFFRGDAVRGFLFCLSTSQWISLLLVIFALYKLFLYKRKQYNI